MNCQTNCFESGSRPWICFPWFRQPRWGELWNPSFDEILCRLSLSSCMYPLPLDGVRSLLSFGRITCNVSACCIVKTRNKLAASNNAAVRRKVTHAGAWNASRAADVGAFCLFTVPFRAIQTDEPPEFKLIVPEAILSVTTLFLAFAIPVFPTLFCVSFVP